MRIALVVPGGVDPPGSERVIPFIHCLVADLCAEHEVVVIAVGHDTRASTWRLFDAEVVNVPVGQHSKADIARVVRSVSSIAGQAGRPDVIHGLWANLPGFAASMAARRHRVPAVVSVCGGEFAALADIGYGGGLRRGALLMARTATRSATAVTVATSWMAQHVASRGGRVDELVPLGADTSIFRPIGERSAANRLVHVGNLNRVKDQALLLHSFRRVLDSCADATLEIAGLDTLGGEMQRLAATLGIAERVRFAGYVQPPQLASMHGDGTIHVLSSRHDAGPVAVLEAAACGVPTIGTAVGHVADFAAMPEPAAVAVAGRQSEALAAAIISLLGDERRRVAIAQRAQAWAVAHDTRHTSRSFESLYRRLIANR
ncbi:MAG: glycosyltransferase family 4 protein [Actinomycetota bacterium]|nr:glycosyltransferase family 4 protein [Actinomycetota bacterium]